MRRPKKITLFVRIMIRLTFPLIFLAVIFTGIQLTNKVYTMNDFYKIESRFAFDSIHKALALELQKEDAMADLPSLRQKLEKMAEFHHVAPIQIFSLPERKALFDDLQPLWTPLDHAGMEESLYQKQLGKPYHVVVDKKTQKLLAYFPLEGKGEYQILVVRVIFPLASIGEALTQSRWSLGLMMFFILLTGILIGQGLAESIVKPIRSLNEATQEIVKGNLGRKVEIKTGDEIQTLGETFNQMTEALKDMKKRAEDSNPLTQLPGNQGIFHELNQRILERQKFVLFHADLNRFKVFNDRYGLARGDEAIQKTADVLKKAVEEAGGDTDFVGHQGGDDFVLILNPRHAKGVAEYVIRTFDAEIVRTLYRREDYDRGFTLDLDRRRLAETGEERMVKFPLLSISLAGISNTKKDFADYFDCMNAAVDAKKEIKKKVESSFLIRE